MKILMVTPGRLPVPARKGGAVETLIDSLLDYNELYVHDQITVVSLFDEEAREASQRYKYSKFLYLKMGKLFSYISDNHILPYRLLNCLFSAKAIILLKKTKETYDSIVIENETVNGYLLSKFIKGNYFFHAHSILPQKVGKKELEFLRKCKTIAISDFLKREFHQTTEAKNVVTVYNGIDAKLFSKRSDTRKRLGFSEEDVVIVFAGRLVPEKGIKELLTAFMELPEEDNIKLLILGASFFGDSKDNSFVQEMKMLCEKKREKIIFTGYVRHEEMPEYYSAADIGCVPSLCEEAFGLSVAEQMAMELPVITTNAGAIPEIVDDTCGIILERGENLSSEIMKSIQILSKSPELRKKMGNLGREIICSKFSEASFGENWFEMLKMEESNGENYKE